MQLPMTWASANGDPTSDIARHLLDRLDHVVARAGGWTARCPAHLDRSPSLSISQAADGSMLVHCFAGCSRSQILAALDVRERDLHPAHAKFGRRSVPSTSPDGLTLVALATAKHLPVAFLRSLGCSTGRGPSVHTPYYDADRHVQSMRIRQALSGDRFRWRRGDHAMPYGLWRLHAARPAGWVLLVEGESDCWTAWYHGLPAIGIPGKATWQPDWAKHLTGLEVVLWQEPDAEDLVERVAADLPSARVAVAPAETKDISEAHCAGADVAALVGAARAAARSIETWRASRRTAALLAAHAAAESVLADADPLALVKTAIVRDGYGGDPTCPLIVYLAATTRLLPIGRGTMPAHTLILGSSSSGKNAALDAGLRTIPADAVVRIDAGSPRVLIYDERALEHRVVVFAEADSLPGSEDNPAASAIRNLAQDGHLHYDVTVRDSETGGYKVHHITKPGPSVLLTTSIHPLGRQLMTRLFTIEVPDEPEHLRAALAAQADLEVDGVRPPDARLLSFQAYLQAQAPIDVVVPFARELAKAMGRRAHSPRILRDTARLTALVKAVAILRIAHRTVDGRGRLVATLDDYATVYGLVADLYEATSGASPRVRDTVAAVATLEAAKGNGSSANGTEVAHQLGIPVPSAWRRVATAVKGGWLVNDETRPSQMARLRVGEALPVSSGLPLVEELQAHLPLLDAIVKTSPVVEALDGATDFTFSGLPDGDARPTDPSWWVLADGSDDYLLGTA
jgi:hypothetical protein